MASELRGRKNPIAFGPFLAFSGLVPVVYPVIPRGVYELDRRGFTLAELLAVLAIVGLIVLVSLPTLLSYGRAAAVKAGAEELVSGGSGKIPQALFVKPGTWREVSG